MCVCEHECEQMNVYCVGFYHVGGSCVGCLMRCLFLCKYLLFRLALRSYICMCVCVHAWAYVCAFSSQSKSMFYVRGHFHSINRSRYYQLERTVFFSGVYSWSISMYCLIYVFSIFVLWNAVFRLLLLTVILLYYNADLLWIYQFIFVFKK